MSSWLPWIIALAVVAVVAVACRFAEEHPRNDEPPDSGDEEPELVPIAA
jgi:hypothetical protein